MQEVVPGAVEIGSYPPQTLGLCDGDIGVHSGIYLLDLPRC